jgi:hypothetical protein
LVVIWTPQGVHTWTPLAANAETGIKKSNASVVMNVRIPIVDDRLSDIVIPPRSNPARLGSERRDKDCHFDERQYPVRKRYRG